MDAHFDYGLSMSAKLNNLLVVVVVVVEVVVIIVDSGASRGTSKKSENKEDKEKDTGLDLRTDLTQSRDLLGKMVSRTSLEWETPETYNDYMRTTLFAGDLKAVKRMRRLQGHINCIHCLQFDRRRLVTCGLDRVVRLWDVRSGRALHKFYGHKGGIRCVQFDNDIMATGSWDCLIMIWDMKQFTNTHTLQGHEDSVTCLEFNDDFLVSGSEDCSVRLWRRPNFTCMLTVWFDSPVLSLVIVDYNFVVSTLDLGVYMLDAYTGTKRRKFEPPLGPVQTLTVRTIR
ncbi:F-box/WD repeat-containing protein 7 [Elysia marginata]|uniref:F-box/WD repeat-containing protein 7 n=1 Tax=Elysia marginata TaxID=1093978 RepID=A0AAV4IVI6_9GAST|nr:F-box/WD repeat-containing protein 7 [Elysia marginata]